MFWGPEAGLRACHVRLCNEYVRMRTLSFVAELVRRVLSDERLLARSDRIFPREDKNGLLQAAWREAYELRYSSAAQKIRGSTSTARTDNTLAPGLQFSLR
jgi:hypothetical protein